jgi:putative phosphoribosyl transferase
MRERHRVARCDAAGITFAVAAAGGPMFADRRDAGRRLAERLEKLGLRDPVIFALPRGGVPVGYEVAKRLSAPLDVFVVRKLGVPGYEELAMGAIASGGVRVLNESIIEALHIEPESIDRVAMIEARELERRERAYRGDRPMARAEGRTAILIDDGLATGATMRAAAQGLGQLRPASIVAAVPVGTDRTCDDLADHVDRVVCLEMPTDFSGVGVWYRDFKQTSDEEVRRLLREARHEGARHAVT